MSEEEIERLMYDIYNGHINDWFLPVNLYTATSDKLMSGVFRGFGANFFELDTNSENYAVLKQLQTDTYIFSGSKTFHNVQDMRTMIFDNKGMMRSFREFRADALGVYDTYNVNWLETEYKMAIQQANSAAEWQEIQATKDVLPFLQFQTAGDTAVRDEHAQYDGIIRKVDDAFWNYANPPLDWGCRCIVIQVDESYKQTDKYQLPDKDTVPKLFQFNPGKHKLVFNTESHPYWKVDQKYKIFREDNFGLPLP